MLPSFLVTLLVFASATFAQSNQECYRRSNNQVWHQPWGWFACNNTAQQSGGALLCCIDGYECGEDSICRRSGTGKDSMWMVGGCTDPEYHDPVCRRDCTSDRHTFITYDKSKSVWQCCGENGCKEDTPTDETFKAISPADWTPITGGSKHTNSPSSNNGDDDLSLGEKIGIGIAVGIVVIALIAAGIFWFWRTTNRSRQRHHGVKGRYEELGRAGRASSPQPCGARGTSPQPYGRSTSPVPPVRSMEPQRGRSRSPQVDERSPLPTVMLPGQGGGLFATEERE